MGNDPYGLMASGLPPELAARAQGLTRKQLIAKALMEQSMQPIQNIGGVGAKLSPFQGLAQMLDSYSARQGMKEVDAGAVQIADDRKRALVEAMTQYQQKRAAQPGITPLTPNDDEGNMMPSSPAVKGDPRAAITGAIMSGLPEMKGIADLDFKTDQANLAREDTQAARVEDRKIQLQARMEELQLRLQDARTSAAEKAELTKQLAKMQQEARADMLRLGASLRPPPAPQPLESILGPDNKPILVNRADAVGKTPASRSSTERNIPAPVLQAMAENDGNIRKASTLVDLLEGKDVKMPGPDGKDVTLQGDKDATGFKGYLPNSVLQRVDPKGVDVRAVRADLGSMVIHQRSGAAVTASEFPRLQPFIPLDTDKPEVAVRKAKRFMAEYTAINNELKGMFSEDQGYRAPADTPKRRASDAGPQLPSVTDIDAELRRRGQ